MNGFLFLVISLLFGFQFLPGGALPDVDQQALLLLQGSADLVEIADSDVPLAGPQAVAAVHRTAQGNNVNAPATPDTTATVTDNTQTPEVPADTAPDEQEPDDVTGDQTAEVPAEEPAEDPAEEPAVVTSVAQRLLARALALVTEYNACANANEKKALLEAPNYSLGNDAFRKKLLSDMGGQWEQVETEVVDATQYQQGNTLYAQVYMTGVSSDFQPVVYATKNDDLSGSQWSTNLVYDEETDSWMEYVKKHPYNDSRVGYGMTQLAKEGALDTLQETMQTSDLWVEVVVAEPEAAAEGLSAPADATGDGDGTGEAPAAASPAAESAGEQNTESAPATAEETPATAEEAPAA